MQNLEQNLMIMRMSRSATIVIILSSLLQAAAFLSPTLLIRPTITESTASSQIRAAADGDNKPSIEVTPELIKHTATLAQLNFNDEEIAHLIPRFEAFLAFVDKMKEVPDDVNTASSSSLPSFKDVVRPDQASVFDNQDGIFANMAKQEDAYLVVPKVGEEDT